MNTLASNCKERKMRSSKYQLLKHSIVFAILAWFLDVILDYLFFFEGTFLEVMLFKVPPHEIFMRSFFVISFVAFGLLLTKLSAARNKAEGILKEYRISLEKMVSKRTKELLGARKQLEDAKRLSDIGTLAATIAHELRNPLGVIKAAAYNIRRKSKGAASLESHLTNIDKKISESDQIIKNLLNYSRIKMPKYENVSCKKTLAEILAAIKQKYSKWNVAINNQCNCGDNDLIEADPVHMTELHFNIIDNAYQSFPNKRGIIEIEGKYNKNQNSFTEIFKDNGIGIDEEDLPKVFEPFFTKKSKGIGLGLTVCKQLVSLHNGTIEIQSKKGKGTTVTLTLPIERK